MAGETGFTPELEPELRAAYVEPCWYAAYTPANHEKRAVEQLAQCSVEYFLALYESVRRWRDPQVRLQLRLLPAYVFDRLALHNQSKILNFRPVQFCGAGQPAGRRLRIKSGPLQGAEGILIRKKGTFRVVFSIDLIMRSVAVEVDSADVEPLR